MKEKIRTYLEQKISQDIAFTDNDDIFEMGLLNSMFALQLVMFLEKEFDIKISNDDLDLNNFNTVTHIEHFIASKELNAAKQD